MGNFTPRYTVSTSEVSPYWILASKGGVNPCTDVKSGNSPSRYLSFVGRAAIPNCTGYAWGRFYEIYDQVLGSHPTTLSLPTGNACDWYTYPNVVQSYTRSNVPALGAIACWSGGDQGYGHVSIVEEIGDGYIKCSESGWGNYVNGNWVWSAHLTAQNGGYYNSYYRVGRYNFQGFILHPAISGAAVSTATAVTAAAYSMVGTFTAEMFVNLVSQCVGKSGSALQSAMGISNAKLQSGWGCYYLQSAAKSMLSASGCPVTIENSASSTLKANRAAANSGEGIIIARKHATDNIDVEPGDLVFLRYSEVKDKDACDRVGVAISCTSKNVTCVFADWGNTVDHRFTTVQTPVFKRNASIIYQVYRPKWSPSVSATARNQTTVKATSGQLNIILPDQHNAVMHEIGYVSPKGEPSIDTSGIRLCLLNLISPISAVSSLIDKLQTPTVSGAQFSLMSTTGTGRLSNSELSLDGVSEFERSFIMSLVALGYPVSAAVGILGNVAGECGGQFDRVYDIGQTVGDVNQAKSRGMCMWNEYFTIYDDYKLYKRYPKWANSLTDQIDYLHFTLTDRVVFSGFAELYNILLASPETLEGARMCAEMFCRLYERPYNVENDVIIRSNIAEAIWTDLTLVQC